MLYYFFRNTICCDHLTWIMTDLQNVSRAVSVHTRLKGVIQRRYNNKPVQLESLQFILKTFIYTDKLERPKYIFHDLVCI